MILKGSNDLEKCVDVTDLPIDTVEIDQQRELPAQKALAQIVDARSGPTRGSCLQISTHFERLFQGAGNRAVLSRNATYHSGTTRRLLLVVAE